jgi:hypothetical protein
MVVLHMVIGELIRIVESLPSYTSMWQNFETVWSARYVRNKIPWYEHQKEHLLGWLAEYGGPGGYNRQGGQGRDARFFYNHFQCVPGLVWFAEAAGIYVRLEKGSSLALGAGPNFARQSALFRKAVTWETIEKAIKLQI